MPVYTFERGDKTVTSDVYHCPERNQKPLQASIWRGRRAMEDHEPHQERFRFLTGSDLRQLASRHRILATHVGNERVAKILLDEADELDRRAAETFRSAS
jgi:hypothetical protein